MRDKSFNRNFVSALYPHIIDSKESIINELLCAKFSAEMREIMFNENLKAFRKEIGYTQESLAIAIHVVRQTVSKWETGLSLLLVL